MGMTASPGMTDLREVDLYRQTGGMLAENRIFINILHFLNLQGLDVLGELSLKVGDGEIGWHIKALLTRRSSR